MATSSTQSHYKSENKNNKVHSETSQYRQLIVYHHVKRTLHHWQQLLGLPWKAKVQIVARISVVHKDRGGIHGKTEAVFMDFHQ